MRRVLLTIALVVGTLAMAGERHSGHHRSKGAPGQERLDRVPARQPAALSTRHRSYQVEPRPSALSEDLLLALGFTPERRELFLRRCSAPLVGV
jgi:hypothetical protein